MTVEAAAKAQAARIVDAKKANPSFNASENQITGGQGTTALYLTTLWDDEAGAAPKSWIRAWFGMSRPFAYLPAGSFHPRDWATLLTTCAESERIPYREGYRPPVTPRTGETIGNMFQQVVAHQTHTTLCKGVDDF